MKAAANQVTVFFELFRGHGVCFGKDGDDWDVGGKRFDESSVSATEVVRGEKVETDVDARVGNLL